MSFDVVYLLLIGVVAPEGSQVLTEAARVARLGSQIVVLVSSGPRGVHVLRWCAELAISSVALLLGSIVKYIDRYLSDVLARASGLRFLWANLWPSAGLSA